MLDIVGRLQLPVHHMVVLHVHECSVRIRFGIAVTVSASAEFVFILVNLFQRSFQILDVLLQLFFSFTTSGYKFKFCFFCFPPQLFQNLFYMLFLHFLMPERFHFIPVDYFAHK